MPYAFWGEAGHGSRLPAKAGERASRLAQPNRQGEGEWALNMD